VSLAYPTPPATRMLTAGVCATAGGYVPRADSTSPIRGWLDRAVLRVIPPAPLRASWSSAQGGCRHCPPERAMLPLIAHLPARFAARLGWHDAPAIDLPPDVNCGRRRRCGMRSRRWRCERTLGRRTG